MFATNKFSSFMISDILRCDKEEEDLQNSVNSHMYSMDCDLLSTFVNHSNDYSAYSSAYSHSNNYLWNQTLDNNFDVMPSRCQMGCQSGPTADTIIWQHYLLRQRMLMQAKPRKGGQIRFSSQQSVTLEKQFGRQKYLSPPERKTMASQLGLTERQIKTWFQNRRAKWRRCKQLNDCTEDNGILFNKYKDTHSCTPDNDNDEHSGDDYRLQNSAHQNHISDDFQLINLA